MPVQSIYRASRTHATNGLVTLVASCVQEGGARYHLEEIDEHIRVLAEDVVGAAASIDEHVEQLVLGTAEYVRVLRREHERCTLALETKLLLKVAQEVAKVDVWTRDSISAVS